MEDLAWLIPVITLILGYTLRGVEQRRHRIQAWDAPKRELYARYLIAMERMWSAQQSLRIQRDAIEQAIEKHGDEVSEEQITAYRESQTPEKARFEELMKAADQELTQLAAEMEILSPFMVQILGSLARWSVEEGKYTNKKPDYGSYRDARQRFIKAARKDLEVDRRTIHDGKPLFSVYWAKPKKTSSTATDEEE